MPAYFCISFEVKKTQTVIEDFYLALSRAGLVVKPSRYYDGKYTIEDIIKWNQEKLDKNFLLGYTESLDNDYRWVDLDYEGFSDTSVGIHNVKRSKNLVFQIFMPEDEFLEYDFEGDEITPLEIIENAKPPAPRHDRMNKIRDAAVKIWEEYEVFAIQTEWELSDIAPLYYKIKKGALPQAEPFCILNYSLLRSRTKRKIKKLSKGGALLENKNNWNHVFCDVDSWVCCD